MKPLYFEKSLCTQDRANPTMKRFTKNELMKRLGKNSKLSQFDESENFMIDGEISESFPEPHVIASWDISIKVDHFFMEDFGSFQQEMINKYSVMISDPDLYPFDEDRLEISLQIKTRIKKATEKKS